MAFANEAFRVRRGNDRVVEIEVEGEDGKPVDLTGRPIRLTYGLTARKALVTKTEADMTISGAKAIYRMTPPETLALEAMRTYWMEARVTFVDGTQNGFKDSVMTGSFIVDPTQE